MMRESVRLINPHSIPDNVSIEACIESLEEAIHSDERGVHQLEICSLLDLDGLTPNKKLVLDIVSKCKATPKVMIRPRQGNFVYNSEEINSMLDDIMWCRDHGIAEVVLGVLTKAHTIDMQQLELLSSAAGDMDITFHKAFDLVPDPLESIAELKQFSNVRYILSSGQATTAWEGRTVLAEMIVAARTDIDIIVAGKVRYQNLAILHEAIGARYYHGRGF